jgi:hypothetical protein
MTDILMKIAVVAGLLAALFFGEQYIESRGYDRAKAEDHVVFEKIKSDARATLLEEVDKTRAAEQALNELTHQLETTREKLQAQNSADLRARRAGPRLQFAAKQGGGCGASRGGTESTAAGAPSDSGAAVVQLPQQINDDLWQLVGEAQSLAIDYRTLYDYVHNPKLVCELRP